MTFVEHMSNSRILMTLLLPACEFVAGNFVPRGVRSSPFIRERPSWIAVTMVPTRLRIEWTVPQCSHRTIVEWRATVRIPETVSRKTRVTHCQ